MTDLSPPEFGADATRAALETLSRDQRDLIRSWLAGFESREDLLRWCHEASVLTLGYLDREWHLERLMSGSELSTHIVTDQRFRWVDEGDTALEPEHAREYRTVLASEDLIPACRSALRSIRWSTVERTHDHDEDSPMRVDPEVQSDPAMRPAITEAAERQEWVIDRGLEGFGSLDDVVETWVPTAIQASFGEIDEDLAADFWREQPLREMFIERRYDDGAPRFFRETFIASELLGPFNLAIAELADRAGEAVSGGETTDHSPATYPTS
ncbi:hypothetical protein [Halolamina salina]|uniref:Ring-1,2-phenylacetyl-CoA epoxidase subunit PaaC n=1 Tax=Halolamina salina TaxID=1220023 RepID=A0ABD6B9D5_9EURY